ncbi:MAG: glycosyltransferase family 2 protein [Methanobrevibacter sp.]|jgi:glycosyltransferase involved in cell wall biosynthesis|nr:glycosyltransferase family 2 protein [Candidatus Methanoflexus mossambicus]
MLSILIPVYNFNCSKLCLDLLEQANKIPTEFEILVYDDCSTIKDCRNSGLKDIEGVVYKELPSNLGRSKIRNLMAKEAKGDYLLFLDCDGAIASRNFLELYYKHRDTADVICGGTIYPKRSDIRQNEYLHWLYGNKREAGVNSSKSKNFKTNNFLIKKKVFETNCFDEEIVGYGHEDTIFGLELKKKGYSFSVIKNPIIHIGLVDAQSFLNNTCNSIENLTKIIGKKQYKIEDFFDIRLVKAYYDIEKLGLKKIFAFIYRSFHSIMEKNLKSTHPNLNILDLYKLSYYCFLKVYINNN